MANAAYSPLLLVSACISAVASFPPFRWVPPVVTKTPLFPDLALSQPLRENVRIACPLQHNDVMACNFGKKSLCVCNYGNSSDVLLDKNLLCTAVHPIVPADNMYFRLITPLRSDLTDLQFEDYILTALETFVSIPKQHVIVVNKKCLPHNRIQMDMFAVKENGATQFFALSYFESFSFIFKQNEVPIDQLVVLKKGIDMFPNNIEHTTVPEPINYGPWIMRGVIIAFAVLLITILVKSLLLKKSQNRFPVRNIRYVNNDLQRESFSRSV